MPRYTLDYILSLDYKQLEKMPMEKLVDINKQAASYAKTRAQRALKVIETTNSHIDKNLKNVEGYAPQAYRSDSIDKYSNINLSALQTRGQIIHNIKLSQDFLGLKTSTIKGYKNVLKNFTQLIEKKTGVKIRGTQQKYFYEVFNRLEQYKNLFANNYQVEKEIAEIMSEESYANYNPEELAIILENKINQMLINSTEEDEISPDEQYILGTIRNKNN